MWPFTPTDWRKRPALVWHQWAVSHSFPCRPQVFAGKAPSPSSQLRMLCPLSSWKSILKIEAKLSSRCRSTDSHRNIPLSCMTMVEGQCWSSLNMHMTLDLVSRASPILFRSTDCFQYRHVEEGSGDLGPLFVDLYGNLNRANEIAEHIIRADFVTWARSL